MSCGAESSLQDGALVRCQQDGYYHGLCFYHYKMMQGRIGPNKAQGGSSAVLRVEKGGHIIYDRRR